MRILSALTAALLAALPVFAAPQAITEFIKTDQFGYRPQDQKIAVISDPVNGFNSALQFMPGTTYEVRNWNTDAVVYSGNLSVWNAGQTHAQSGDRAWWFDFSSVSDEGSYYIFDPANNVGSYRFEIAPCVYNDALKTAMRMYYYQRCGFAKELPYADPGFTDAASHLGPQQDTDCRLFSNVSAATSRDLRGGWYDAGDYNKYVNFTWTALTDLLLAYAENPSAWTDDFNIPESGNGIPDILDEIRYELDWLLRMQNADGSMLSVVGGGSASPPSADTEPRRYGPATTSATLTGAGIFALAAIQFEDQGQTAFAAELQQASENAWQWADQHPDVQFYNAGQLAAGEQEVDEYATFARKMAAAVYLYARTGNNAYRSFVDANYNSVHLMEWGYAYPFETSEQDMLLYYASLTNATPSVSASVLNTYAASMSSGNDDNLPSFLNSVDAYRAYVRDDNYTWNSNQTKAKQANMFLAMNSYGLDGGNIANYENAASGFVHYFHGVNPMSKTYLSNMAAKGAENSVTSFYHAWFHDGSELWDEVGVSEYGPAPGYVPGGVNPSYDWDDCCYGDCGGPENNALCTSVSIFPPKGQPIQKSWKDFNTSWPLNSWTVTEAGIYTQAAYVRMLSKFAGPACVSTAGISSPDGNAVLIDAVYPQPSAGNVFVRLNGKHEAAQIVLTDLNGKTALSQSLTPQSGNLISIAAPCGKGVYLLQVISDGRSERRRIVF
jgi:endoglucanase